MIFTVLWKTVNTVWVSLKGEPILHIKVCLLVLEENKLLLMREKKLSKAFLAPAGAEEDEKLAQVMSFGQC